MTTVSVPIADSTHGALQEICAQPGKSISEVVDAAVTEYQRKLFFVGVDRDFAALKADPQAWAHEVEERRLFENSLMDGLDAAESWSETKQG